MADKLTENQRKAVVERKNVVVSAGAGSGKTKVLSMRFADLVESGDTSADRILTLTFMNKAAVEMKSRIFNQLTSDAYDSDLSGERRENAKAALKAFDKVHIQTLDSYFSEIVREGAHFYGISPSFKIDDDRIESLVGVKALQFILARNRNKAIQALTRIMTFSDIAKNVFAGPIIKNSSIVKGGGAKKAVFASALEKQKLEVERVWNKSADEADSAISCIRQAGVAGKTASAKAVCKCLEIPQIENPLSSGILKKSFWESLEADFSGAKKQIEDYMLYLGKWTEMKKPSGKDVADVLPFLEMLYQSVNTLVYLVEFIFNSDVCGEIMRLLDLFDSEVQDAKRSSGILTFKDVSDLAMDILQKHDEIRHIEQGRFDKIMIDEFQDNNARQCDALFMLSDERERFDSDGKYVIPNFDSASEDYIQKRLNPEKLFFVGDEKQGIYRFRGADVTVFRNLQTHLRGEKFSDGKNYIYLETNFRSMPNLVKSFNAVFGGNNMGGAKSALMKREDGIKIPDYEAEYLKVEWNHGREDSPDNRRLHFAMFKKTSETKNAADESGTVYEASYIAHKIKELVKAGYKYGDIAVLFRASSVLGDLESEFLKARIPYSTEIYKGFFSDGPINDIVSFLKVCVYPADMNALSVLLRSPFVGLSREDMELFTARIKLLRDNPEIKRVYPFDENSMVVAEELFGSGSSAFDVMQKAKAKFDEISSLIHKEKISSIVSRLWYEYGYRYETLWNLDVQMFASLYDILFELARKAEENTQSIAGFLDEIEEYNSNSSKIENLNIPFESNDGVKFITVHKSKGLEFKVVFVCAVENEPGNFTDALSFTKNFGPVLSLPPSTMMNRVKTKDLKDSSALPPASKKTHLNYFLERDRVLVEPENSAELRRLTYVAFTRAIDELFIVGKYSQYYKGVLNSETVPEKPSSMFASVENVVDAFTQVEERISEESGELIYDRSATADSPFDFEEFSNKFSYDDGENGSRLNVRSEKAAFVSEISAFVEKASVVEKDYIEPVYVNPSLLEKKGGFFMKKTGEVPMREIDELVESTIPGRDWMIEWCRKWNEEHPSGPRTPKSSRARFSYADFGSVAHLFMQEKIDSVVEGREAKFDIPGKYLLGLDVDVKKSAGDRTDVYQCKVDELKRICGKMAENFSKTDLFAEVCSSEWKRTEMQFRLSLKEIGRESIVNGTVDLVFKNSGDSDFDYTIVDYKTDREQHPERYYAQLAAYRMAVSQMKGVPFSRVRCVLYFLRYDESRAVVDVTDFAEEKEILSSVDDFLAMDFRRFEERKDWDNPYERAVENVDSEDEELLLSMESDLDELNADEEAELFLDDGGEV